jgi:hypothetical protein
MGDPSIFAENDAAVLQEVKAVNIPEVTGDDGTRVRIVAGNFWGKDRPGGRSRRGTGLS